MWGATEPLKLLQWNNLVRGIPTGAEETQGHKQGWRWGWRLQTKLWLILEVHPGVRFSPFSRFTPAIRKKFFYCKSGAAPQHVCQKSCGCPVPGSGQE